MKHPVWRRRTHLWALLGATMGLSFTILVVTSVLWRLPQLERDSQQALRLQAHDVAARLELQLGARQSHLTRLAGMLPGDDAAGAGAPREVWLRVADDGHGIAAECFGRIFEPLAEARSGWAGVGLGLFSSANTVATLLGGSLVVDSREGQGAAFELRLPTQAPVEQTSPDAARRALWPH